MSAYATYEARACDLDGTELGSFQFRMIESPTAPAIEALGLEYFGCDVNIVDYRRVILINRAIGRSTPATRLVSARTRVVALWLTPPLPGHTVGQRPGRGWFIGEIVSVHAYKTPQGRAPSQAITRPGRGPDPCPANIIRQSPMNR